MSEGHGSRRIFVTALVLAVALAAGLAAGGVAAQSDQPEWSRPLFENASEMVTTYNEQVTAEDLGAAAGQLKGERVDLVVEDRTAGETAVYSFRMTSDLQIRELSPGPREDATLRMTTTRATVERINEADRPGRAFRSAVRSRDIEITGVGLVNRVKWTVINGLGGALGFFK